jgi:predicted CXXCH cytochrome family protein
VMDHENYCYYSGNIGQMARVDSEPLKTCDVQRKESEMGEESMSRHKEAVKISRSGVLRALSASATVVAILLVFTPGRVVGQAPPSVAVPAAQPVPPPAPVPRGDLEITVVAPDGKKFLKFQDCRVNVRDQAVSFGEGGGPQKVSGVPAVPDEVVAVTAEALVAQAAGKPAQRFVGVAEAYPDAAKLTKVTVSLKRVDDINAFCAACHPGRGQRVKPGQIKRDTHPSGKPLEGRYRQQVSIYNEKVARLSKEGKPHNEPIAVEERLVKVGAKEVKKDFYTCESCHTLHATTPNPKYMRAPYLETSDLCTGCHF